MKPPRKRPCSSCPYRKDVPSGVWDASEYEKLPEFDRPTFEQPAGTFACHQDNGHLCSGWVACHDMEQNLGLRIAIAQEHIDADHMDEILDYETPVELWESGQAARDHGMKEIDDPSDAAIEVAEKLLYKRSLKLRKKEK